MDRFTSSSRSVPPRSLLRKTGSDYQSAFPIEFDPVDTVQGNQLIFPFDHGYANNDPLRYTAGGGSAIGGLTDGDTYYVHVVNEKTIELRQSTTSNASIVLGNTAEIGQRHTLQQGLVYTSARITGVSNAGPSHTIDLGRWHGLRTGQQIRYSTGGAAINGLTKDQVYYVIVDGENKIALANSESDALLGQWQFVDAEQSIKNSVLRWSQTMVTRKAMQSSTVGQPSTPLQTGNRPRFSILMRTITRFH